MAIGDGDVLSEALKKANGDVEAAVKLFNDLRHSDIRAHLLLTLVTDLRVSFWIWKFRVRLKGF